MLYFTYDYATRRIRLLQEFLISGSKYSQTFNTTIINRIPRLWRFEEEKTKIAYTLRRLINNSIWLMLINNSRGVRKKIKYKFDFGDLEKICNDKQNCSVTNSIKKKKKRKERFALMDECRSKNVLLLRRSWTVGNVLPINLTPSVKRGLILPTDLELSIKQDWTTAQNMVE